MFYTMQLVIRVSTCLYHSCVNDCAVNVSHIHFFYQVLYYLCSPDVYVYKSLVQELWVFSCLHLNYSF